MKIEDGFLVPADTDSTEQVMADFLHTHTCTYCGCFVNQNLTGVHRGRCREWS